MILTLRHEEHFIVIPTRELKKRIPRGCPRVWNLYLWVLDDGSCYQVRDLGKEGELDIVQRGVRERHRDFSQWVENWKLLDEFTGKP